MSSLRTAGSDSEHSVAESHVHDLSNDQLDNFLQQHDLVLLVLYHSLVPRWQRFSQVFEQTAIASQHLGEAFAKIDCAGNAYITQRYPIQTYPTVLLVRGPDDFKVYKGPLRKKDIIAYLTRQKSPVTTIVTAGTFDDFKDASDVVVVGYFDAQDSVSRETFHSVAEEMYEDLLFGIVNDVALAGAEQIEIPSIVVYKSFDEAKVVVRSTDETGELLKLLKETSQPLIVEFLPELHDEWTKSDIFLGYLFAATTAQQNKLVSTIRSLAEQYKRRIQFGIVEATIFDDLMDTVHLSTDSTPAFAIRDPRRNLFYPMNDTNDSLFSSQVAAFVTAYFAGAINPTIKSAPLPREVSSPIVEVVTLNYEIVVFDPAKDVLIEYYTSWCGPCKALLPEYERLATMFASDERVTIAKLDVEANDIPGDSSDIRGFPTFKLFATGRKNEPLLYDGPRTLAGWKDFINKEGTHGVGSEKAW